MDLIKVRGRIPRINKLVQYAAWWSLERLLTKRMLGNVIVDINITKLDDLLHGYCDAKDTHIRPRRFEIGIHRDFKDTHELLTTVCHECVHVKQMVYNELKERHHPKYRLMWFDLDQTECEHPFWEIQADWMENKLYYDLIKEPLIQEQLEYCYAKYPFLRSKEEHEEPGNHS